MIMQYDTFKKIVNKLQAHEKTANKLYNYVRVEIFDDLYNVTYELLKLLYSESSIDYVFYPYLLENNKEPVVLNGKEYPITNTKELYEIMEMLNKDVKVENPYKKKNNKKDLTFEDLINGNCN